jgi:uncharacterized protein (TIGR03492 family)
MTSVLILSNGHGEDTIAATVAVRLQAHGVRALALPLVGRGEAYRRAAIEVVGPVRDLPSGGYLLAGPGRLWADLRAGFLGLTVGQWSMLRAASASASACLAVGDWYALLNAVLFGSRPIFHVQPAVSVRAWPTDAPSWKSPYGPLERSLMKRCRAVYPRDGASARWLVDRGVGSVRDLGNPMLDAVTGTAPLAPPPPYLLLLPGSRRDAAFSLPLMLEACRQLRATGLTPVVAWSGARPEEFPLSGWECEATGASAGGTHRLRHGDGTLVHLAQGSFASALAGAHLALSTSGTAAEQAAGRGVPLVGFPTPGPQYTAAFADGQQRALGEALTLARPAPDAVVAAVLRILGDSEYQRHARRAGKEAMGEPGAAERIALDIVGHIGVGHIGVRHISGPVGQAGTRPTERSNGPLAPAGGTRQAPPLPAGPEGDTE